MDLIDMIQINTRVRQGSATTSWKQVGQKKLLIVSAVDEFCRAVDVDSSADPFIANAVMYRINRGPEVPDRD